MATDFYTTREAAKVVGVTRATIQAWIATGRVRAPKLHKLGNVSARLWTKTDVAQLRAVKKASKIGRPKKSK